MFARVCSSGTWRRKSLPPIDSSTSLGVCSASNEGKRSRAWALVLPGTPALTTRQPVSPASRSG
jgi:hypothetical protein